MSQELLEEYIQTGNTTAVSDLLGSNPRLATIKTSHNISPLMLSCYYNKPEISAIILEYAGEPDIYEASATGKFDSVANLIYKNKDQINTFSEDGFTPLGLACFFGHEEIARYLLLKGAEVNAPSQNGFNVYPIHSAVAANNSDITKILLEAGAEVNVKQQSGITPLHSAAFNGNIEIIILLLEAGSNVKAKMDDGKTPADKAEEKGFKDIARILAE
jgi:ankyrin repeat protein